MTRDVPAVAPARQIFRSLAALLAPWCELLSTCVRCHAKIRDR